MSFFYPQQAHSQSPFLHLFDQPRPSFYPTPDDPYHHPRYYHSHHPHRQSTGPFYPHHLSYPESPRENSSIHPLGRHRQQKLERDALENYPQNLGYGYHNSHHPSNHHPLHQLRRQKLNSDALEDQSYYTHPSHRASFRENSSDYEDSIRRERARRLAEAKMRQLGRSSPDEETKVQVTLPDGRQCVVPISWAQKMQKKYPGILTNAMIRPHLDACPSSVQIDQPLANSDSDHDSDFYLLDPTQDPSVPVLSSSSPPPYAGGQSSSSPPQFPKHTPEEQDAAARLIQQQFRAHRSLVHLAELESTFDKLKTEFTYPSLLDLKFAHAPEQADGATPPSTKLTFNHPVNRSIQALEEGLTQLQIKADAILSRGNPKIKTWRKQLIKAIEAQLEQLDRFKTEAWTAQRAAHLESLAKETRKADECEEVEMNDEIMNTDVESVASDRLNVDSAALSIPLPAEDAVQAASRQEDDLIIPVPAPATQSLETLVIPARPFASNPSAPGDASSLPDSHTTTTTSCNVNPLVTSDGSLICPAPPASLASDDILISPV
ncbi:hypothetical protein PCANC_27721 [Puccinia coronata f. sp. avenae]|uniref:BAG domain-containing protein n=1 Tax=Puccinia coronata f. sp. avenae TaxID=200324 RepID=A0A2N5RYX6_9BASI|nr:hypothetical protein PCANC_27721 [Puccinia coronata f. sp. avenae]